MSTLNDDRAHARGVLRKVQSTGHESAGHRNSAAYYLLEHIDRVHDRRLRGLMFLISWLTLVGYLVLSCACASTAAHVSVRNVVQENEAAVRIYQTCGDQATGVGSGVIIDAHHVLTADHMKAPAGCIDVVQTSDGNMHIALTDKAWPDRDLARLTLAGDGANATPITIAAPPEPGESVCLVPTWPRFDRRCGDVQYYRPERTGAVDFTVIVMPGNSGSGVYDMKGRLVGITLATMKCPAKDVSEYCSGEFASLDFLKSEKP